MLLAIECCVCGSSVGPVCVRCEGLLQPASAGHPHGLDACRVGFTLNATSLAMITALKYRGQRRIAAWLGATLAGLVPLGADMITWVPTTVRRERERGYDQSRELAESLGRHAGLRSGRLLRRRGNDRQTGKHRIERLVGPQLTPTVSAPNFVVVVDDVMTTGTTLRLAAEALRRAGAERVVGCVVATTPRSAKTAVADQHHR